MIPFSPYYKRGVGNGMQSDNRDIVTDTLDYYRARTSSGVSGTPKPYLSIQEDLTRIMKAGKKVLIDIKDSYSVQTVIVKFDYVNERWAKGTSICYSEGEEIYVPYTIHFSDILCKRMKIKVIKEGENPFARS